MNAKIAIPVSEGKVFAHFGKAVEFRIYTIEEDRVTATETLDAGEKSHEDLACELVVHGVNAVLCDNIGPGAQGALVGAGIESLAGVSGSADDAIAALLAGILVPVTTPTCGGHGGSCGGHGGSCGHHGGCHGGCCGGCH